jgi:hypothetical protein
MLRLSDAKDTRVHRGHAPAPLNRWLGYTALSGSPPAPPHLQTLLLGMPAPLVSGPPLTGWPRLDRHINPRGSQREPALGAAMRQQDPGL